MDCKVHEVAKSRTQLRAFHFHFHLHISDCCSAGNLDSSLWFIQPDILHDVLFHSASYFQVSFTLQCE